MTNGGLVGECSTRRLGIATPALALSIAVLAVLVAPLPAGAAGEANAGGTIRTRVLTPTGPRSSFTGAFPDVRVIAGVKAGGGSGARFLRHQDAQRG